MSVENYLKKNSKAAIILNIALSADDFCIYHLLDLYLMLKIFAYWEELSSCLQIASFAWNTKNLNLLLWTTKKSCESCFQFFFFAWKMTELIIKMAGFYFYNRSVG